MSTALYATASVAARTTMPVSLSLIIWALPQAITLYGGGGSANTASGNYATVGGGFRPNTGASGTLRNGAGWFWAICNRF